MDFNPTIAIFGSILTTGAPAHGLVIAFTTFLLIYAFDVAARQYNPGDPATHRFTYPVVTKWIMATLSFGLVVAAFLEARGDLTLFYILETCGVLAGAGAMYMWRAEIYVEDDHLISRGLFGKSRSVALSDSVVLVNRPIRQDWLVKDKEGGRVFIPNSMSGSAALVKWLQKDIENRRPVMDLLAADLPVVHKSRPPETDVEEPAEQSAACH